MSRHREIELKLEVEEGCAAALSNHSLLAEGPKKSVEQLSVYFDTPDGAIRDAGYSLRVRRSGKRYIQTVKASPGASAGLFDRPEWESEVGELELDWDAAAETPLRPLLTKKVMKRLKPLIRVEARRSVWDVEHAGSRIELVLDEGSVSADKAHQPLTEIELELKSGDPAALFALARELGDAAPLRIGVLTKAERGYRLADGATGKAVKSVPVSLDPGMSAADGFAAIGHACLRQFRLNEPLVIEHKDPSGLHQSRVAMRRLRSAFTLFRPVIDGKDYGVLREEVRWFTNQLGDARNLDVMLKRFGGASGDPAGEQLLDRLEAERDAAYVQVLEAMGSARLRRLLLELIAWIETGNWRQENTLASLPLPQFASLQLDKRWKKVRKGGRDLAGHDPETRHRLRIEVKKLRYAVEFLASLTRGEEALARQKQFVRALEDMQEELGYLNDAETARILLSNLLAGQPEAEAMLGYANGRLEATESEDMQLQTAQKAHMELVRVGRFWR